MKRSQKRGRRTLMALAVLAVLVFVAFSGTIAFVVLRNLEIARSSDASALQEISRVRQRFAGRSPLVAMTADAVPRVNRPPATAPRHAIESLHVRVWNPKDRQLVRLSLPPWVLRMGAAKGFALKAVNLGSMNVDLDDIERHGPGPIVDYVAPGGEIVVVWTE